MLTQSIGPKGIEELMVSKDYSRSDISAVLCAYEVAEEVHRHETRKLGGPYIRHPEAVLMRLIGQGHDYETLAAGVLHDTCETLQTQKGYEQKEDCLDHVSGALIARLTYAQLFDYIDKTRDVTRIVSALSKDTDMDFFEANDQIFELDDLNLMRALIIKCTDRYMNALDTMGYVPKKKEIEFYKTFAIGNRAKEYLSMRDNLLFRLMHRWEDFGDYLRERSASRESIVGYVSDYRASHGKRMFLLGCIELTIEEMVGLISSSIDESISKTKAELSADEACLSSIGDVEERLRKYEKSGGFNRVTRPRRWSSLDGRMIFFFDITSHKEKRADYNPTLIQHYENLLIFKRLFEGIGNKSVGKFVRDFKRNKLLMA